MSSSGKYRIIAIESICDFFGRHLSLNGIAPDEHENVDTCWWFRGHTDMNFSLLPSLYRKVNALCEVKLMEERFLNDFCARNYHNLNHEMTPESMIEWLCLMQHYGLPTRLLDWSESAVHAFIFALESFFIHSHCNHMPDKPATGSTIPCVWALKPKVLNSLSGIDGIPNIAMFENKNNGMSLTGDTEEFKKAFYTGLDGCGGVMRYPVAVLHPYNNERIRAQLGTFTLFPIYNKNKPGFRHNSICPGCDKPSVRNDEMFRRHALEGFDNNYPWLVKYVITKPFNVYRELALSGLRRSMIYPNMSVVSGEIEKNIIL